MCPYVNGWFVNDSPAVSAPLRPGGLDKSTDRRRLASTTILWSRLLHKRGREVNRRDCRWHETCGLPPVTMDNDVKHRIGSFHYERAIILTHDQQLPRLRIGNPIVDAIVAASGIPVHGTTFTNIAGDHVGAPCAPSYTANNGHDARPLVTNATITWSRPICCFEVIFLTAG